MKTVPLLQMTEIGMVYRDGAGPPIPVLDDFNVAVGEGQIVCVAGRSGSGKSTALLIAAGLLTPTTGRVAWGTRELAVMRADEVTRTRASTIGVMFQDGALISTLRADENVALPAMAGPPGQVDSDRVDELLKMVGLADRARHFPAQLSGGEQQRIALARALYRNPSVLVVDEPTATLDRSTADTVIQLLDDVRRSGRGLLVASHDPNLIALANYVVQLD